MEKILIIERNKNIQNRLGTNLSARGYQVLVASSANTGIRSAQIMQPDLIMVDIDLPDTSGWDVLQILKNDIKLCRIPVFLISAALPDYKSTQANITHGDSYLPGHTFLADSTIQMKLISIAK